MPEFGYLCLLSVCVARLQSQNPCSLLHNDSLIEKGRVSPLLSNLTDTKIIMKIFLWLIFLHQATAIFWWPFKSFTPGRTIHSKTTHYGFGWAEFKSFPKQKPSSEIQFFFRNIFKNLFNPTWKPTFGFSHTSNVEFANGKGFSHGIDISFGNKPRFMEDLKGKKLGVLHKNGHVSPTDTRRVLKSMTVPLQEEGRKSYLYRTTTRKL